MIHLRRLFPAVLFKTLLFSTLLSLLSVTYWVQPLSATPNPVAAPDELRSWIPWILEDHPDLLCPLIEGQRLCAWPGRLALELDDRGGTFELELRVDRELDLKLPGDSVHWPREVRVDGGRGLMRRIQDQPWVQLKPGSHRVQGRFRWSRLPESLAVPPQIALVDLRLRGSAVRYPKREADGLLWLAASRRDDTVEERLDLEVQRLFQDGIPVTATTRLVLRVSGGSRAVELGAPLPAGFVVTGFGGDLPLRWTETGGLVAQVRPGTWQVTVEARSLAPVQSIPFVERAAPWPPEELWAFRADPAIRSVRLSGAPGIDPQRTSMPEDWKSLPLFQLTPGTQLDMTELRRGEAEPPPDAVQLQRVWWLEQAGDRFTVRDSLNGQLFRGGRLQATAPAELGRMALLADESTQDQVITLDPNNSDGHSGIEVRSGSLSAAAELTYPRGGSLPAVGWDRDVTSLATELRLPPGWTLIAAIGADEAVGSWIGRWNLLDLFLVLILSLATWRLDGVKLGVAAFLLLGISWHEPQTTVLWWWWLTLLPLRGLLGILPGTTRAAKVIRGLRWAVTAALAVQLVMFCTDQWRTGLFPVLEKKSTSYSVSQGRFALPDSSSPYGLQEESRSSSRSKSKTRKSLNRRARQVDANAVVQTGSGVPTWAWKTFLLKWKGPVTSDHQIRLWLISPGFELLLSLIRIVGAVLLAGLLIDPRRTPGASPPAADPETQAGENPSGSGAQAVGVAAVLLIALSFSGPSIQAQEPATHQAQNQAVEEPLEPTEPTRPSLLNELEQRLTQAPLCHPKCVELPRLDVKANADGLWINAEIHAAAASAWRLPGPAATWTPARVTVDGKPSQALRLGDDGFFMLRLAPGIHQVELSGSSRDSLVLELSLAPRAFSFKGDGWTLDGWRRDEAPPNALRLDRQLRSGDDGLHAADDSVAPEPWLELYRELDIGIPWLVHNELRRHGPAGGPVLVRVPLLKGESVTTGGVPVEDGEAIVGLEPGETVRRFDSTLEQAERVELTAPEDQPWLETWELACSPIWSCDADGLAPTRHLLNGTWQPRWQPWPGEQVTVHFVRPAGAPGKTTTIDGAKLFWNPGRRLLEGKLVLDLRTSRGGEQVLELPADTALQSFQLDGREHPVQVGDGGRVAFTLEPGSHQLEAQWRLNQRSALWERMPSVTLGSEVVNVEVTVEVPANRWLLWTGGPGWGPVVQFWQYLLAIALAGWALGRFAPTPLKIRDWLLLGLGMTQVPLIASLFVVAWLVAIGMREHLEPKRWWSYDFFQLVFGITGLIALGSLYAAVHSGLLFEPDMQVLGEGSYGSTLHWYVDRAPGALPQPWVLSLPMWVWRVLMLLWSLWLASSLLKWLPWCWQRLAVGPLLLGPKSFKKWTGDAGSAESPVEAPVETLVETPTEDSSGDTIKLP